VGPKLKVKFRVASLIKGVSLQAQYFFEKPVASQNTTFLCPPVKFLFPALSISFPDKFPKSLLGCGSPIPELSQYPICG
jgi:hypothetical protein